MRALKGEYKANVLGFWPVAVRICAVSFLGMSGIRHTVEVEAETLYEAAVIAVARFRKDIWGETIGPGTQLDIEVQESTTTHSISLHQVERWIASATSNPSEASKKVRLKMMLMRG